MLSTEALAALNEQIEALSPSAAVLEMKGCAWQLAQYLAQIVKSGEPDLSELRCHGVSEKAAVEICTAISERHARKAAALAAVPLAKSIPPAPVPTARDLDAWTAMSRLHTFCTQLETGHAACLTTLCDDGWSPATAREIAATINAARPVNLRANGMPGFQRRIAADRK